METDYIYEILMQGNCPALAKGMYCVKGDSREMYWDHSGSYDLFSFLSCRIGTSCAGTLNSSVIRISAGIITSVKTADDWLIPCEMLDISREGMRYIPEEGRVVFRITDKEKQKPRAPVETVCEAVDLVCTWTDLPVLMEISGRCRACINKNIPVSALARAIGLPELARLTGSLERECFDDRICDHLR